MIFSWEFPKLLESIISRNIFICVEKLNYVKNYMKTRREIRRKGLPSPYFVLRNKTGHLNYTRPRRSAKYEKFMKTFLKQDQDRLNWKISAKIKPIFFLPSVFLFIMYYRGIPFYASIISSVLEEFRPVSGETILCKSSHYDC